MLHLTIKEGEKAFKGKRPFKKWVRQEKLHRDADTEAAGKEV